MSLLCTFVQLGALIHQANIRAVGERLLPVSLRCVLHRWHSAALVCSFLADWAHQWKSHSDWPFSKANQCTGRETWKKGKPSRGGFHDFTHLVWSLCIFHLRLLACAPCNFFLSDLFLIRSSFISDSGVKTLLHHNSIYQESFSVSFEWHI